MLSYYNKDHLGNNHEVVDAKGVVQQVTTYYPFGAPYADDIYDIVCGMLCQGKNKSEIEQFLHAFNKCLDPSMLNNKKGYGVDFGNGYGYNHYKYNYYLLTAILRISDLPYMKKDIMKFNQELNRFYQLQQKSSDKLHF